MKNSRVSRSLSQLLDQNVEAGIAGYSLFIQSLLPV